MKTTEKHGMYPTPAGVLNFIRAAKSRSASELHFEFGIGDTTAPSNLRRIARLRAILRDLLSVGLLNCAGDAEGHVLGLGSGEWAATPLVGQVQAALELSLSDLASAQAKTTSETRLELDKAEELAAISIAEEAVYREDLLATLRELGVCFDTRCHIAVMGLSGKVLEICVKQRMLDVGLPVDDNMPLGRLIGKLTENGQYVPSSIGNICNVINQSRIPAVHAKKAIPVPTREQAAMVLAAVLDMLKRTILCGDEASRGGSSA